MINPGQGKIVQRPVTLIWTTATHFCVAKTNISSEFDAYSGITTLSIDLTWFVAIVGLLNISVGALKLGMLCDGYRLSC